MFWLSQKGMYIHMTDFENSRRKINMNPDISTLRKCSGSYSKYNSEIRKYEIVNFELGAFHQFGCTYEEFENGAGNYTTAIVELPNGQLVEATVNSIKFVED